MNKKIKDDLIFVISAFGIGLLYFGSQQEQETSTLVSIEVLFVLTFALRRAAGLAQSILKWHRKKNDHRNNEIPHISA